MVKPYPIQWFHHQPLIRCRISAIAVVSIGCLTLTPLGLPKAVAQLSPTPQRLVAQNQQDTQVLLVNPITGDDINGNGNMDSPFKTIAKALEVALPNTVIVLAPGIYSFQTGETFPLILPDGVTLQGNPRTRGENIIIQGGGLFESPTAAQQNITILAANPATVTGVTITNPNPQGYGLWIESSSPVVVDNTFTENTSAGIVIKGNSAPTIRSNYFYNNGGDGILVAGTLQADVRENVFIDRENATLELSRDREAPLRSADRNSPSNSVESPTTTSIPETESVSEPVETTANPSPTPESVSPIIEPETIISQLETLPTTFPSDWRNISLSVANPSGSTETQPAAGDQTGASSSTSPISAASFPVPSSLQSQPNPTNPATPAATVPQIIDISVPSPTETAIPDTSTPATSTPEAEMGDITVNAQEFPSRDSIPVLSSNNPSATPQEPPLETAPEGRYRVLVAAATDEQQTLVRSLIPGAFRTSYNGKLMMQVGLFSSRENAQEILNLLQEQGLTVTIETLQD
jgi:parallel beta-helix repeat protein